MQKRRTFWRRCKRLLPILFILLMLLLPLALSARAGGAGGSSSSSSGGSSGGGEALIYLIIWMVRILGPIPTLIIIGTLAVIGILASKTHNENAGNALNNIPDPSNSKTPGKDSFMKANPGFDASRFEDKVRSAFMTIQEGWTKQDISAARRYISDGVYQRFTTQFAMMKLLKQENRLSDIRIHNVSPVGYETDGDFSVIHMHIKASMRDEFRSPELPQLNSADHSTFVEYWSFIRRGTHDHEHEHDMYASNTCPKCDAPLPDDPGERVICSYCNALVNSGEYDWVLSEITQADDYGAELALRRRYNMAGKSQKIRKHFPDFSVQQVEDHASNAFFQVMRAVTAGEPEVMRRFTTDKAYESISAMYRETPHIYNRLYTNFVTLIGGVREEDYYRLYIAVTYSAQRVRKDGGRYRAVDPGVMAHRQVLSFKRKIAGQSARGSILMHQCAACGGPINDSTDTTCQYCGAVYNSGDLEWVLDEFMDFSEYQSSVRTGDLQMGMKPELFDNLYGVGEYVLINLCIMAAADGVLAEGELEYLNTAAGKLGVRKDRIEPILEMAKAGRLSVRMPLDLAKRRKIIDLMKEMAMADGQIQPEEAALLEALEQNYEKVKNLGGS